MLFPKLYTGPKVEAYPTLPIIITIKFILGLQLGTIALTALCCGALAPRNIVELFQQYSSIFLMCGGGSLVLGLAVQKNAIVLSWIGHSFFGTGGAAVIAAWASSWACCDPMQRVIADDDVPLLMPRSAVSFLVEVVATTTECDITTPYAGTGRRAVMVCCALSMVAYVIGAIHQNNNACIVGLGSLFAAIVCNEADWDWRPVYANAIALLVAFFFSSAADAACQPHKKTGMPMLDYIGLRIGVGWCVWLSA